MTTAGATGTGAGDAVTGVGFDGFCVCWMHRAHADGAGHDDGDGCGGDLVGHADGPLGHGRGRGHRHGRLLRRRGRAGHHVVGGLPQLAEEPGRPEPRQEDDRGQGRDAATLAAAVPGAAETLLGAVDQRLGLLRRHAEGLADLLVRPSLELAQDQRLAVVIGDLRQDRADLLLIQDAFDRLGRVVGQGDDEPGVLGEVGCDGVALRTTRAGADHVERHVGGDARDPRLELIPAVERAQAAVDPQHRLLDGLVGLLAILQDAVADLGRQGPVLHVDVGVGVDVTRLEREHQALVVVQVETRPGEVSDIGEACGQGPPFSVWFDRGNVGDRPGVVPPQQHRHQPIDDLTPRD